MIACGDEQEQEADRGGSGRTVYLVTLPHPVQAFSSDGYALVAPETKSKQEILNISRLL